jgi:hypothetical protein
MRLRLSALLCAICFGAVAVCSPGESYGQHKSDPKELVAALKRSLAQSKQGLRKYEWIETTSVSLKGEEKSRKQNRCYYGAEGQVQKVALGGGAPEQPARRGLRGRIIAKKKGELTDYAEQAAALVKLYVPPDPAQIQAINDAGDASVLMNDQRTQARLDFRNYMLRGDMLSVELDAVHARLLGANISTYLNTPKDALTLTVSFGTLPDGTSYPAQIILDMPAKNLRVTIQNSGYRPLA